MATITKNVLGSMVEAPPLLEFGVDTVYIREDVVKVPASDEVPIELWKYTEMTMTYPEYTSTLASENEDLRASDLDNKVAITELFEMVVGGGSV